MADIDATATLAAAMNQSVINGAPTDQSLNAGALLPSEPIPDVLTNEVATDTSVIMEMIPKLNPEEAAVAESLYVELSYLRDDLITQRGMNQKLATEAISVLPNFGKHKPVNWYSKHPSFTGYQASLEEIDKAMAGDLATQIQAQIIRLEQVSANPGQDFLINTLDFKRRANKVSMLYYSLRDFQRLATDAGFSWDDPLFQAVPADQTQTPIVADILKISRRVPYSFATMDAYYTAHLEAPAAIETMTTHLTQWKDAFDQHLAALKVSDSGRVSLTLPTTPTVAFGAGAKVTSVVNVADVFRSAEDKMVDPEATAMSTLRWIHQISNAAQESKVEVIVDRLKSYNEAAKALLGTLQEAASFIASYDSQSEKLTFVNDTLYKLTTEFAKSNLGMCSGVGEIAKWCGNAGLATSFAATLVTAVTDVAWKAILQCKDTLQMPEENFNEMKATLDGIVEMKDASFA
jgi:hypothetical protein